MSRFLLEYANSDLSHAAFALRGSDDISTRQAAFHTEQCIEKLMMKAASELGIRYDEGHDVNRLLDLLPENNPLLPDDLLLELSPYAGAIVEWATKIRYNENTIASRRSVVKLYELAGRMLSTLEQNIANIEADVSSSSRPSLSKMNLGG